MLTSGGRRWSAEAGALWRAGPCTAALALALALGAAALAFGPLVNPSLAAASLMGLALGWIGAGAWLPRRARRKRRERAGADFLAGHDLLTGARNPGAFARDLALACAEARAGGPAPAVICIDLQGLLQ